MFHSSDDGFSLVEVAVSTMIVVVFFLAFASSLETATDSLALSRTHTQAAAVLSQEVEFARSLTWDALAMPTVDPEAPFLASEASVLSSEAAGLKVDEPLVVASFGSVAPKVEHRSEQTDYTAWRYVTEVGPELRRVVVLVEWQLEDQTRQVRSSTLISEFGAIGRGATTTAGGG